MAGSVEGKRIQDRRIGADMHDTVDIYALTDPHTGAVRYIGKAVDAAKRFKGHMRDSRRRHTPVYCWIKALADQGLTPDMTILARVPADRWQGEERRQIAEARRAGVRLLNLADGGDQPSCPTATRAANGKAVAAAVHGDPDRKAVWNIKRRMGLSLKQGFVSNARRASLRESARICPELFACFANIPDREENPNGSPVHGYRIAA